MFVPFEVAGRLLGIGSASGMRAGLSLFLLAAMARFGWVDFPTSMSFLTSTPALGALLAASVVEEWLERDDDAQQLAAILKYGLHGTGGLVLSWLLIERLGLPLDGWPIAIVGGVLAVATHKLRLKAHDLLRGIAAGIVSPRRWLSWLETGGVVGLITATILSPLVALGFVAVASVGAACLWMALRYTERLRRRPCPTCATLVRKEARLCPHCRETIPVDRWLGGGLFERIDQATQAAEPIKKPT